MNDIEKRDEHGGNIIATAKNLGCKVSDLVDMSSNLTPFNAPAGLREALTDALPEIAYLPETGSESLRYLFAKKFSLHKEQVLVGNGTTEFIHGVPATVGVENSVIINPTYSDYLLASKWAGLAPRFMNLRLENDFQLDLGKLAALLTGGELVFICNPNNPTGTLTPSTDIHNFICQHRNSFFLVDESYLPFTRKKSLLEFPLPENLFVLRSFSKIYGIPGLRLGFLISTEQNMTVITSKQKPWGVNRLAQVAGEYLIRSADDYVERVRNFLEKNRPAFAAALKKLPGVRVIPGDANFILCYLTGMVDAYELRRQLLTFGIMARNCANFMGLSDRYFRLSLKNEKDNRRCIEALGKILAK